MANKIHAKGSDASMMTRSQLLNYKDNLSYTVLTEATNNLEKFATAQRTVFLSHSHHDIDLVEAARIFFASQGLAVYVDWKDSSMPRITSPETALRLQKRMIQCDKFVLLATERALESNWVPWELGYADGKKDSKNIAIFPIAENNGTWIGREYLGIYSHIKETLSNGWGVFAPREQNGYLVKTWLDQ